MMHDELLLLFTVRRTGEIIITNENENVNSRSSATRGGECVCERVFTNDEIRWRRKRS